MRKPLSSLAAGLFAAMLGAGAALAADTQPDPMGPKNLRAALDGARMAISEKDYDAAISRLQRVIATNPRSADAYSLLGYSYRKNKDYDRSERNYLRALRLDPDHKGALEYIGELYLETDRRPKAEEMLAKLEKLCPSGCEELEDLRKAMAGIQSSSARW